MKKTRIGLFGALDFLAISLGIATLLGFLGRFVWFFDLFSHFRVQYMQLCLPLIGIALWQRSNKRAGAIVVLAMVNYALVLPFYFGNPEPSSKKPVRAMLMNINAGNGNSGQVLAAIRKADPDILLLEEVTGKWARELAVLNADYPYKVVKTREDYFGILLLSKHPLKNGRVVEIGTSGLPSVAADVYLPDGEISFIGTHPVPPIGGAYSRNRNNQLQAIPELSKAQKHPVLLMGDLNISPWSPHFSRLVNESGLNNSMKGFGFQPSWPAKLPFMRIPLDHALHSEGIAIHNRMVGGDVGSDHFPLIVDFSLR